MKKDEKPKKGVRKCPECGSENTKKIVFGLMSPQQMKKLDDDEMPGGCIVSPAQFFCLDCECEW